ncbi:hypothetical protein V2J09_013597 [Rumex salicifolius]
MLYDRNLLFAISSTIGIPLRIDSNTLNVTRERFARVCVELDLTKPLKGELFLNGERLEVEYESLHLIYFTCGHYGHDSDHFPNVKESNSAKERASRSNRRRRTMLVLNVNYRRGIWLLWHSSTCKLVIVSKINQFIHATVGEGADLVHVLVVYACPDVQRRVELWQSLSTELDGIGGGDFNVIQNLNERQGGSNILSADSIHFGDWIHRNNLIDLGFQGSPFTWARGSEAIGVIQKRLDRVLVNSAGRLCWPEVVIHHLPRFFQWEAIGDPQRRPFSFQASWISHPRFNDFLTEKWNCRDELPVALESLKQELLQQQLARAPNNATLLLNRKIQEELDLTLEQEEIVSFHKSRQQWISCGDRNTKFFHMSTVMRRRSNRILALKIDVDRWCVDPNILENHAL